MTGEAKKNYCDPGLNCIAVDSEKYFMCRYFEPCGSTAFCNHLTWCDTCQSEEAKNDVLQKNAIPPCVEAQDARATI
jgi:hypothetical protein